MFERVACAALVVLASCATAHEAVIPDDDPPSFGGGGASTAAGAPAMAGRANATAGATSNGGALNSAGGAATTGGTTTGGVASGGATTGGGGSHSGGAAGSSAGASNSGSLLFGDDFEDGSANGWVTSAGTWAVTTDGSKVYAQTATGTGSTVLASAPTAAAWTNQIIEARLKVKAFGGSSTSYFAAIYGRYTGSDYYALALRSDGKIAIRKNTSTLGSAVAADISEGTWYTVRFEIVGSTLKAYVDGALKDTESDSSLTSGGMALAAVNTTAEFDDVKVTQP